MTGLSIVLGGIIAPALWKIHNFRVFAHSIEQALYPPCRHVVLPMQKPLTIHRAAPAALQLAAISLARIVYGQPITTMGCTGRENEGLAVGSGANAPVPDTR